MGQPCGQELHVCIVPPSLRAPQAGHAQRGARGAPSKARKPPAVLAMAMVTMAIKGPTKRRGDNAGGGRGAAGAGCPGDPSGAFRRYFLKKKHTHARQPH